MKYLTGIHALNLECSLETSGDWHMSGLKWEKLTWADTNNMFFKDYGITLGVPNISGHIRPQTISGPCSTFWNGAILPSRKA